MKITSTYLIDEERYQSANDHRILLETIQYAADGDILTRQIIHARLKKKLLTCSSQRNISMPDTFYFIEKRRVKDKKPISQTAFEDRVLSAGVIKRRYREVIEELPDTDHQGRDCAVIVVITQEGEDGRHAGIEFETAEQWKRFAPPGWLVPMDL